MPNVEDSFRFSLGDVVLVDWEDKLYYAKILNICASKSTCRLLFDDGSSGSAHFNQIHNVNETTSDILCVVCKEGSTSSSNEIVLCDSCSIGFHQSCHDPTIPVEALEYFTPWICAYCRSGSRNPHIEKNPFAISEDNKHPDDDDENHNSADAVDSASFERNMSDPAADGKQLKNTFNKHGDNQQIIVQRKETVFKNKKTIEMSFERKLLQSISSIQSYSNKSSVLRGSSHSLQIESDVIQNEDLKRRRMHENSDDQSLRWKVSSKNHHEGIKRDDGGFWKGSKGNRNLAKMEVRGSKHQKGNLRQKMARRYMMNFSPFGFTNRNRGKDYLNHDHGTNNAHISERKHSDTQGEKAGSGRCYNQREIQEKVQSRLDKKEAVGAMEAQEPPEKKTKRELKTFSGHGLQDDNKEDRGTILNGGLCRNSYYEKKNGKNRRTENDTKDIDNRKMDNDKKDISNRKMDNKMKHVNDKKTEIERKDGSNGQFDNETKKDMNNVKNDDVGKRSAFNAGKVGTRDAGSQQTHYSNAGRIKSNERMDKDYEVTLSAFDFVKDCLRSRPGSLLKHRQELQVDYKKTKVYEKEKIAQCKHSDAMRKEKMAPADISPSSDDNAVQGGNCREIQGANPSDDDDHTGNIMPVVDKASFGRKEIVCRAEVSKSELSTSRIVSDHESKERGIDTSQREKGVSDELFPNIVKDDKECNELERECHDTVLKKGDSKRVVEEKPPANINQSPNGTPFSNPGMQKQKETGTPVESRKSLSRDDNLSGAKKLHTTASKHSINLPTVSNEEKRKSVVPSKKHHCEEMNANTERSQREKGNLSHEYGSASFTQIPEGVDENEIATFAQGQSENPRDADGSLSANIDPMAIDKKSLLVKINCDLLDDNYDVKINECVRSPKEVNDIDDRIVPSMEKSSTINISAGQVSKFCKSLPGSSSHEFIIKNSDDSDASASLGIRISDVFSLNTTRFENTQYRLDNKGIPSTENSCTVDRFIELQNESSEKEMNGLIDINTQHDIKETVMLAEQTADVENKDVEAASDGCYSDQRTSENASPIYTMLKNKSNESQDENLCKELSHPSNESSPKQLDKMKRGGETMQISSEKLQDDAQMSPEDDQNVKRKRKKRTARVTSASCEQSGRLSMDLPRHNWLIERLLSENKIDNGDLEEERSTEETQNEESRTKTCKRKRKNKEKGKYGNEEKLNDLENRKRKAEECRANSIDNKLLKGSEEQLAEDKSTEDMNKSNERAIQTTQVEENMAFDVMENDQKSSKANDVKLENQMSDGKIRRSEKQKDIAMNVISIPRTLEGSKSDRNTENEVLKPNVETSNSDGGKGLEGFENSDNAKGADVLQSRIGTGKSPCDNQKNGSDEKLAQSVTGTVEKEKEGRKNNSKDIIVKEKGAIDDQPFSKKKDENVSEILLEDVQKQSMSRDCSFEAMDSSVRMDRIDSATERNYEIGKKDSNNTGIMITSINVDPDMPSLKGNMDRSGHSRQKAPPHDQSIDSQGHTYTLSRGREDNSGHFFEAYNLQRDKCSPRPTNMPTEAFIDQRRNVGSPSCQGRLMQSEIGNRDYEAKKGQFCAVSTGSATYVARSNANVLQPRGNPVLREEGHYRSCGQLHRPYAMVNEIHTMLPESSSIMPSPNMVHRIGENRSGVGANALNERDLNEKADSLLKLIKDESISKATKQELFSYWRLIRKMPCHVENVPRNSIGECAANRHHLTKRRSPLGDDVASERNSLRLLEEMKGKIDDNVDLSRRFTRDVNDGFGPNRIVTRFHGTRFQNADDLYESKIQKRAGSSSILDSSPNEASPRAGYRPPSDPYFYSKGVQSSMLGFNENQKIPSSLSPGLHQNISPFEKRSPMIGQTYEDTSRKIFRNSVMELEARCDMHFGRPSRICTNDAHLHSPTMMPKERDQANLRESSKLNAVHFNPRTITSHQDVVGSVAHPDVQGKDGFHKEQDVIAKHDIYPRKVINNKQFDPSHQFDRRNGVLQPYCRDGEQPGLVTKMYSQHLEQHEIQASTSHQQQKGHMVEATQSPLYQNAHRKYIHSVQEKSEEHDLLQRGLNQQNNQQLRKHLQSTDVFDKKERLRQQEMEWKQIQEKRRLACKKQHHRKQDFIEQQSQHIEQFQRYEMQEKEIAPPQHSEFARKRFMNSPPNEIYSHEGQSSLKEQLQRRTQEHEQIDGHPHLQSKQQQLDLHTQRQQSNHMQQKSLINHNAYSSQMRASTSPNRIMHFDDRMSASNKARDTIPFNGTTRPDINNECNASRAVRMCESCGQKANFLCSRCRKSWYCSEKCQVKDWKEHKRYCKKT